MDGNTFPTGSSHTVTGLEESSTWQRRAPDTIAAVPETGAAVAAGRQAGRSAGQLPGFTPRNWTPVTKSHVTPTGQSRSGPDAAIPGRYRRICGRTTRPPTCGRLPGAGLILGSPYCRGGPGAQPAGYARTDACASAPVMAAHMPPARRRIRPWSGSAQMPNP